MILPRVQIRLKKLIFEIIPFQKYKKYISSNLTTKDFDTYLKVVFQVM